MHVTITLVMYWIVSLALACGGLYALNRGFNLVLSGRGESRDESSLELFGIRATVGSLGSLVMVTAFFWGYAAVLALPSYEDADIRIQRLTQALEETENQLADKRSQLGLEKSDAGHIGHGSEMVEGRLRRLVGESPEPFEMRNIPVALGPLEYQLSYDLRLGIEAQRESIRILKASLDQGNIEKSRQQAEILMELTNSLVEEFPVVD